MTDTDVREELRRYMARHSNKIQAAKGLGFALSYIRAVVSGYRPVTRPIAEALGFEVVYRRRG